MDTVENIVKWAIRHEDTLTICISSGDSSSSPLPSPHNPRVLWASGRFLSVKEHQALETMQDTNE